MDIGIPKDDSALVSFSARIFLGAKSFSRQKECDLTIGVTLEIKLKHPADNLCFFWINDQFLGGLVDLIAESWKSSRPFAFLPGCAHLVFSAFTDYFPFKLGERKKDI